MYRVWILLVMVLAMLFNPANGKENRFCVSLNEVSFKSEIEKKRVKDVCQYLIDREQLVAIWDERTRLRIPLPPGVEIRVPGKDKNKIKVDSIFSVDWIEKSPFSTIYIGQLEDSFIDKAKTKEPMENEFVDFVKERCGDNINVWWLEVSAPGFTSTRALTEIHFNDILVSVWGDSSRLTLAILDVMATLNC